MEGIFEDVFKEGCKVCPGIKMKGLMGDVFGDLFALERKCLVWKGNLNLGVDLIPKFENFVELE
jgi:hypothetical protein